VTNYRLTRDQRLRSQHDFARVYDTRCRVGDKFLLVFGAANSLSYSRAGSSVSKKKHGNAVRRARLKRLLREAFRLSQHELPIGLDLVLIPQAASEPTLADLQKSLGHCARQLQRKLKVEKPQ
jgi:ribonuclease P protein component